MRTAQADLAGSITSSRRRRGMSASAWQQQGWGAPPASPYPAPPQAARWSAPTHPGPKTNTLAVLAILAAAAGTTILVGLGSIAAIVMGAVALGQVRRTGEDGGLLAVWAIVVGAVTLVALVVAAITGVAMIVQLVEQMQGSTGF
jgi:peptidyl-prolyl cis-trans isomerase B (cyclophilin B)